MSIDTPPSVEPINTRVTGPEAHQQELVITTGTPRYSLIDHKANKVTVMSSLSTFQLPTEVEREFYALAERWRHDTAHMSLSNEKANHFAYHQIMAMGPEVLPLIFRELPETTSDWFWALRAIAREKAPLIPEEDRGRVRRIAEIWMEWGRQHGYVAS